MLLILELGPSPLETGKKMAENETVEMAGSQGDDEKLKLIKKQRKIEKRKDDKNNQSLEGSMLIR